jgi:uncharacterized protein (TIGR02599 family)
MKKRKIIKHQGFSLVEMLVAVGVFGVVMVLVFQMLDRTQNTWQAARDSTSEYKEARNAFDSITRRLSQTTLNTYWQIKSDTASTGTAEALQRLSDLHYVSGDATDIMGGVAIPAGGGERIGHCMFFQAPTGKTKAVYLDTHKYQHFQSLLNVWGYFVEFNTDRMDRPQFMRGLDNPPAERPRFRLMEYTQSAEINDLGRIAQQINLAVETSNRETFSRKTCYEWFLNSEGTGVNYPANYTEAEVGDSLEGRNVRLLAENILALIILPTDSVELEKRSYLSPKYLYDSRAYLYTSGNSYSKQKSRNQLPPTVDITMIALDETDMRTLTRRLQIKSAQDVQKVPFYAKVRELFKDATRYEDDMLQLRTLLSKESGPKPIQFRTFRATVRIRESRWGGVDPALGG